MAYATKPDMIALFESAELVSLTDRAKPPTGAIDDGVLGKALDDAAALMDAYLTRYQVPVSPVPPILVALNCDIARYRLYDNQPTDIVRERYKNAIDFLKDVQAGRADLGSDVVSPSTSGIGYSGDARVFSRETLADYL